MHSVEGPSVAQPLGEGEGAPIEWPEEVRPPRADAWRWLVLAASAVIGATAILIGSGLGDAPPTMHAAVVDLDEPGPLRVPVDAPEVIRPASTIHAVAIAGQPMVGRTDALVTVVTVQDYACGTCDRAREAVAGVRARFPQEVRVVYAPYPTLANRASLLGACAAARQGAHEPIDAMLWRIGIERARTFGTDLVLPDGDRIAVIAREQGLDGTRFAADLASCELVLTASRNALVALHVTPPAVFVNGRLVEGDAIATLDDVVAEELALANTRIAEGTTRREYYDLWVLSRGSRER